MKTCQCDDTPIYIGRVSKQVFRIFTVHIAKIPHILLKILRVIFCDEVMLGSPPFIPPTFHLPPLWGFFKKLEIEILILNFMNGWIGWKTFNAGKSALVCTWILYYLHQV